MQKLKVLDLFSGIGGFSLGLERTGGFETVAFCEYDDFCQKVLKKHWPDVPIYKDVRNITKEFDYGGSIQLICGGYPCQGESIAGLKKGEKDDRYLWPEMFTCVQKYRPTWVIGENVANHANLGLDRTVSDLESEGYRVRTFIIPACSLNAKHRRDRVWIVAHTKGQRSGESRKFNQAERSQESSKSQSNSCGQDVADSCSKGLQGPEQCGNNEKETERGAKGTTGTITKCSSNARRYWSVEPNVGRVAHGIPSRVDRLKSLGNAVVPQIPEILGHAILRAEKEDETN